MLHKQTMDKLLYNDATERAVQDNESKHQYSNLTKKKALLYMDMSIRQTIRPTM